MFVHGLLGDLSLFGDLKSFGLLQLASEQTIVRHFIDVFLSRFQLSMSILIPKLQFLGSLRHIHILYKVDLRLQPIFVLNRTSLQECHGITRLLAEVLLQIAYLDLIK